MSTVGAPSSNVIVTTLNGLCNECHRAADNMCVTWRVHISRFVVTFFFFSNRNASLYARIPSNPVQPIRIPPEAICHSAGNRWHIANGELGSHFNSPARSCENFSLRKASFLNFFNFFNLIFNFLKPPFFQIVVVPASWTFCESRLRCNWDV